MTENNMESMPLPPIKVAFVIDGQVVEVFHTDERLSAILLSNPTIIDATEFIAGQELTIADNTIVGWQYDGSTFTKP
jgi:hypothetical protein